MTSQGIIKNLVFDLGGVLIDWNPRYLYRKLIQDEAEIERFLRDVCNSDWNDRLDAGLPFSEGVRELCERFPDQCHLIRAYHERWPEMLAGSIPETEQVLRLLHARKSHRLFALSNWSAETFPYAESRFEFLSLFEGIVLSGREKVRKPDPRIFGILCERYSIQPAESLFIDDVEKNVEAARGLGFNAVNFSNWSPSLDMNRLM